MTKKCCRCENTKDVSEFGKDKSQADKINITCKDCLYKRRRLIKYGIETNPDIIIPDLNEVIDGITYTERWVPVMGYEHSYLISDFGRVKTIERILTWETRGYQRIVPRILLPDISQLGYHRVALSNGKKNKRYMIHRLVGQHFIPNPLNKPQINHKRGIKSDNRYHQLEWLTCSENRRHAIDVLKIKVVGGALGKFGKDNPFSKKLICLDTGEIYHSVGEASAALEIPYSSISSNCRGLLTHARGKKFNYI